MKFEEQVINFTNNSNNDNNQKGKLYIVSTPIGNNQDITIRAMNLIKLSDFVICEEMKEGASLLKQLKINKELLTLNEQNEEKEVYNIINLIKSGKKLALISDAGTPIFADPGLLLLKAALKANIDIEVVPGASSIMTALVRCGFNINKFFFAGFLSRKSDERIEELKDLINFPYTMVLLETPYRLLPFLEAASAIMPNRNVYLGMNLTMIYETHHYGTFRELYAKFSKEKVKSEFVVVVEGNNAKSDTNLKEFDSDNKDYKDNSYRQEGSRGYGNDRRFNNRGDRGDRSDNRSRDFSRNDKKDFPKRGGTREPWKKDFQSKDNFRRDDYRSFDKPNFKKSEGSDRESFGEKKFGERKFGERKFGEKKFGEKKFGEKKFGEKKSTFKRKRD